VHSAFFYCSFLAVLLFSHSKLGSTWAWLRETFHSIERRMAGRTDGWIGWMDGCLMCVSDAINDLSWLVYKSSIALVRMHSALRHCPYHKWWNFSILIAQQCTHHDATLLPLILGGSANGFIGMEKRIMGMGIVAMRLRFNKPGQHLPNAHTLICLTGRLDIQTVTQPAHSSTINLIYVSKRLIHRSLAGRREWDGQMDR